MIEPGQPTLNRVACQLVRWTRTTSDQSLLAQFVASNDEQAFAELVRRYGGLVMGVCRRVLDDFHQAEDVFQATFLVLARKGHAVRREQSLGGWLYRVAYRLALHARSQAARMPTMAEPVEPAARDARADVHSRELCLLVDEELQRLPEKYRVPLVACYLEGKTQEQCRQELRWSLSTFRRRLKKGTELLRGRLTGRGLTPAVALTATTLAWAGSAAPVNAALVKATAQAAAQFALPGGAAVSANVLALAGEALRAAAMAKVKLGMVVLVALGLIGGGAQVAHHYTKAEPRPPAAAAIKNDRPVSEKPQLPRDSRGLVYRSTDPKKSFVWKLGPAKTVPRTNSTGTSGTKKEP